MCIICNVGTDLADPCLWEHVQARLAMQKAADAFMAASKVDRRYDATHKAMVRLIRDWNRLEETREHVATHHPAEAP